LVEQQFKIAAQMVDCSDGNIGALFGFGQNECALDRGLGYREQGFPRSNCLDAALAHGFFYVRDESGRMSADALVTGLANRRLRVINLLHHGTHQAGEIRQLALN
jgi:hypothetical protein